MRGVPRPTTREATAEGGSRTLTPLRAGILEPESSADAEHIASAPIAGVNFVVSWNFKHIVHYERISAYQAVNLMNGYREIRIYSPREVVNYDEE